MENLPEKPKQGRGHTTFADRTQWDLTPNSMTRRKEKLRQEGIPVIDLTESNPTRVGFQYPKELLSSLSDPGSFSYEPSPKGLLTAREAVASLYGAKGLDLHPDQVLLTASTSEAYSFLFRLLANPGDEVLVPRPSYPLFEYLAGLHDVRAISYPLSYKNRWAIDFEKLSQTVTSRTKAIVVVHPNHPTGSCLTDAELGKLAQVCHRNHCALIADEVFAEYLHSKEVSLPKTLGGNPHLLTFSLGGLSKFMGLPQMKLAWIAATGPQELLPSALERLEVIADTFLSVSTLIQQAFPRWLTNAPFIQSQILARLDANRQFLQQQFSWRGTVEYLESDGGWMAVLRCPSIRDEESFVLELLEEEHTLLYPGYFFDFEEAGILVVSLLTPPGELKEGVERLLGRIIAKG